MARCGRRCGSDCVLADEDQVSKRQRPWSAFGIAVLVLVALGLGTAGSCALTDGLTRTSATAGDIWIGVGLVVGGVGTLWWWLHDQLRAFAIAVFPGFAMSLLLLANGPILVIPEPSYVPEVQARIAAYLGVQRTQITKDGLQHEPYWPGIIAWLAAGGGVVAIVFLRTRPQGEKGSEPGDD